MPVVLGISDSHDAGVSLIDDGRIVIALNEERVTRRKNIAGFPFAALREIWRHTSIRPSDVDLVAVAGVSRNTPRAPVNSDMSYEDGSYPFLMKAVGMVDRMPFGRTILESPPVYSLGSTLPRAVRERKIRGILREAGIDPAPVYYDHHLCHIASGCYTSGWDECLSISNDSFGDGLCSRVAVCRDGALEIIVSNPFTNSLGTYYDFTTNICGFRKEEHCGKTMGLAAFGDPGPAAGFFRELIFWDDEKSIYRNAGPVFGNLLGHMKRELAAFKAEDIAAGMQARLEEILVAMVAHFIGTTGVRRVALSGGIHANVKANQRIAAIPGLEEIFVFPTMGDGGISLGAALLAGANGRRQVRLDDVYLGPAYSETEIKAALDRSGLSYGRYDDPSPVTAGHLSRGRIVARFDGRMEYGPRALGNRSILSPSTDTAVNQRLNDLLGRTEFMPFAPVIREEDAGRYLIGYDRRTARAAEYMTITYDVTELCKKEAPAIVHVDGTARPQIVRKEVNRGIHDILTRYRELTGLGVLINTSFNMHEEPIVCTPEDAIAAYRRSGIDILSIGPFVAGG